MIQHEQVNGLFGAPSNWHNILKEMRKKTDTSKVKFVMLLLLQVSGGHSSVPDTRRFFCTRHRPTPGSARLKALMRAARN